jgi:alkylhydroperoxidase family enzyme
MEHVVLALILMAFTVSCAYCVHRHHAARHTRQQDVALRAEAVLDYHLPR